MVEAASASVQLVVLGMALIIVQSVVPPTPAPVTSIVLLRSCAPKKLAAKCKVVLPEVIAPDVAHRNRNWSSKNFICTWIPGLGKPIDMKKVSQETVLLADYLEEAKVAQEMILMGDDCK